MPKVTMILSNLCFKHVSGRKKAHKTACKTVRYKIQRTGKVTRVLGKLYMSFEHGFFFFYSFTSMSRGFGEQANQGHLFQGNIKCMNPGCIVPGSFRPISRRAWGHFVRWPIRAIVKASPWVASAKLYRNCLGMTGTDGQTLSLVTVFEVSLVFSISASYISSFNA